MGECTGQFDVAVLVPYGFAALVEVVDFDGGDDACGGGGSQEGCGGEGGEVHDGYL